MVIFLVLAIVSPFAYEKTINYLNPKPDPVIIIEVDYWARNAKQVVARSFNNEKRIDLQRGRWQSALVTPDYVYNYTYAHFLDYGKDYFSYVDLHTGEVFFLIPKEFDEQTREEFMKYHSPYGKNTTLELPKSVFIDEEQLDEEKRHILNQLKKVHNGGFGGKVYIYESDLRK